MTEIERIRIMECPVCGERLKEIERAGVEVDVCPSCKGIWLDRGELDKLLERERDEDRGDDNQLRRESHDDDRRIHDNREEYRRPKGAHEGAPPRRRSLLSNLLEGIGGD
jgi:uncharacterized protein